MSRAKASSSSLGDRLTETLGWGDASDPLFHEYVAREHLDDGMPVIELHRNHGVPLSAVKRWIATYQEGGREAIERAASEAKAKEVKRLAKLAKQAVDPAEIDALVKSISSSNLADRRAAYAVVAKRRLVGCIPAVVAVLGAARRSDSVQEELELLATLGAADVLHDRFEAGRLASYVRWRASLMKKAGCALRRRAGVYEYELRGKWHRAP